jgi:predicted DNA-binding protein (MmcQ/YjbR family)
MDGSIPDQIIFTWIDNSYDLVYKALPLSKKKLLKKPL